MTQGSSVVGLFAGIGGIEQGLASAGHHAELLCEVDPAALAVLADRMPDVALHPDIRKLRSLPKVDIVAGGFPCQDLSQAGRTAGIGGERSGLVDHALRLVRRRRGGLRWLLLEGASSRKSWVVTARRRRGRRAGAIAGFPGPVGALRQACCATAAGAR